MPQVKFLGQTMILDSSLRLIILIQWVKFIRLPLWLSKQPLLKAITLLWVILRFRYSLTFSFL